MLIHIIVSRAGWNGMHFFLFALLYQYGRFNGKIKTNQIKT